MDETLINGKLYWIKIKGKWEISRYDEKYKMFELIGRAVYDLPNIQEIDYTPVKEKESRKYYWQKKNKGIYPDSLGKRLVSLQEHEFFNDWCPPGVDLRIDATANDQSNKSCCTYHAATAHLVQGANNTAAGQHHSDTENNAADKIGQRRRAQKRKGIERKKADSAQEFENYHAGNDQQQ